MRVGPVHFYHVYAVGDGWRQPVDEHIRALLAAEFSGDVHLGLVGSEETRAEVIAHFAGRLAVPVRVCAAADVGWEQVTLAALSDYVQTTSDDYPVLYAHSKGASDPSLINVLWRREMTLHLVRRSQRCVDLLSAVDVDAVGCHWLTPQEWDGRGGRNLILSPFFGGNFWWARSSYLRRLPPLSYEDRHRAEAWIGLGEPRVVDLVPGWPNPDLCRRALQSVG